MTEISTIVVALDGSLVAARALPIVKTLGERTGASVTMVTSTADGRGASSSQHDDAQAQLGELSVGRVVRNDLTPVEAAIGIVSDDPGRLLCLSTHGRSGLRRAVLGSVADDLIRAGPHTLLLVGPSCDPAALGQPGSIELCVDGSNQSHAVVEAGRLWAKVLDCDVQMVMLANPMNPTTGWESTHTFADLAGPLIADGLHAGETRSYNRSIPGGLIDEAKLLKSQLMIIAPEARSTWTPRITGNTTLRILSDAPCPVPVLPEVAASPGNG